MTKTADIERWGDNSNLSVEWDKRAELAAEWIPKNASILDIGCGRMAVEKVAAPLHYFPVDIVARDERTIVVDLNLQSLPVERIQDANFATLLGVLEYLKHPEELLSLLAKIGIPAVCSYQLADFTNKETRTENGWFNSYTALDFACLIHHCGYKIVRSRKLDAQGLYLLEPRSVPESASRAISSVETSTSNSVSADASHTTPSGPSKPKLVLSGFFGRGNTGDESLLQVQYEHFSKDFEVMISVEQHGAFDGFWNWYPYNQCKIIGQEDLTIFGDPDVVGLHVGGGNLPIGFNASQIVAARAAGKVVQASGVDAGTTYDIAKRNNPELLMTYLDWTSPWVRSQEGFDNTSQSSSSVKHGADWALGLPSDSCAETTSENCLLILREFPKWRLTPEIRYELGAAVKAIQERFGTPVLLPFCPEDERFISELETVWGLPCQTHWWNPSRIKQYISQAKMVISVGRLHPMIFAACTRTPAIFCEWGLTQCGYPDDFYITPKSERVCMETGMQYHTSLRSMADSLRDSKNLPQPRGFDPSYLTRFEMMKKAVTDRFLEAAKPSLG